MDSSKSPSSALVMSLSGASLLGGLLEGLLALCSSRARTAGGGERDLCDGAAAVVAVVIPITEVPFATAKSNPSKNFLRSASILFGSLRKSLYKFSL